MSTIKSSTTTTTAYQVVADTTGTLVIQTGSTPTTAVTVDASQNTTLAGYLNTPNTFGFKNRIINGAMVIDQRNAGASVTPSNGAYTLDRWLASLSQASKFSVQRNAGSVTPPVGYINYLGTTSLSAYTVGSGEIFVFSQAIEGFNVADLGWGAAGAQTVTLSFWVRSSLTGTFGGAVQNNALNRSYPFSFTISAANTWEQKSITIPGDTSGTWLTNNGVGIWLNFGLGVGTTYSGTAGSWAGANYVSATGATSVVGTNGATFYITGVQLEKGSTATSFDYRPYGTELALCQRYCVVYSGGAGYRLGLGYAYSTTGGIAGCNLPVTMRSAPSISGTASNVTFNDSITAYNAGAPTLNSSQENFVSLAATSSGMTAGRGNQMYFTSASSTLVLSAEL